MAGHMGTTTVTVKNLKVVGVDPDKQILMVKGAVPGNVGSIVEIRAVQVVKKKNAK
jgi:large subunit ribosomal protein L3